MTLTNRFAGFSIRRALVVGVVALGLAAGTVVRLGGAEARAADLPYQATDYKTTCNHLWDLTGRTDARRVDVMTNLTVTRSQYANVWVQLTNYSTGKVLQVSGQDWTISARGLLQPGWDYRPMLRLDIPDGIYVRAKVQVDWYDPAANYAYEGSSAYAVTSYLSVEWGMPTWKYYDGC
jgi:hypothetical protein